LFKLCQQTSKVVVNVLNHPVEPGGVGIHFARVTLRIFFGTLERRVGRIRREVGKERRLLFAPGLHPIQRLAEKQIRAVAFGLFKSAIVPEGWIEIRIPGRVAATARIALSDPASPMNEHLIETALVGLVGRLITKMPFTENA